MKNNIFVRILFLIILSGLILSGCEKAELYSCDPTINSWINDNIENIQSMTRSAWVELPENIKGPVFGAFTPEQKSTFWDVRLKEILLLDWNEKEKEHLSILQQAIMNNKIWFETEKRTDKIEDEMAIFAFKWINYAKEVLKWNENLTFAIVASGNKLINKSGEIYVVNEDEFQPTRLKDGTERSCNCNQKYDFVQIQNQIA